jgi:endonuclease/exonuclease/phosphatase family metal-dependent hydrolase
MLVRTWNVFHGNASPPERHAFLEQMIRLVTEDRPAVLCLQELPVWSLRRLGSWSGMHVAADVARRPTVGPFPSSAEIGRVLTDIDHGRLRSAFTGQANAILVERGARILEHRRLVLNSWSFRRAESRRLFLGRAARREWRREPRLCQVVRLERSQTRFVVANLHATGARDRRLADAEVLRAATFVDGVAEPEEPLVLAGDFNVEPERSTALRELARPDWGLAGATPHCIDHVLVRGLRAGPPLRWPEERHLVGGRLLSDHAPVERSLG